MNGSSLCGAVLISKRFVLTAAHCQDADRDFAVGTSTFRGGRETLIIDRAVHPLYDDFTYNNDIALFELKEDAKTEDGLDVPYVKLDPTEIYAVGIAMTVIGFGDTNPEDSETEFSQFLRQVDVNYVSNTECRRDHRGEIDEDMMCAEDLGKDACYGDSGGPLLLTPDDENHEADSLVGIVSWGRGCADEEFPGVYTRISYFYDWIVGTMCVLNSEAVPSYVDCDEIMGIDTNRITDVEEEEEEITPSPTPSPTVTPTPAPTAPPTVKEPPACGDRGASCSAANDCCSSRCNFTTGTCFPASTGNRDRVSIGMGGSGSGAPAQRTKTIANTYLP